MPSDATEQPVELRVGLEVLNHAKRRDQEIEGSPESVVGDIAVLDDDAVRPETACSDLLAAQVEHRVGQVEAVQEAAPLRKRDRDPPGPAPEFEDAGIRTRETIDVERHVVDGVGVEIVVLGGFRAQIQGHGVVLLGVRGSQPR